MRFLPAALLIPCAAIAAEGMWPLDNLPASRLKAEYSFTPGKDWVEHVTRASARMARAMPSASSGSRSPICWRRSAS